MLRMARSSSTKMQPAAPRLSASIPNAPLPAKRSNTCEPTIQGCRILNNASRARSLVGRAALPLGSCNCRPLSEPDIIRTAHPPEVLLYNKPSAVTIHPPEKSRSYLKEKPLLSGRIQRPCFSPGIPCAKNPDDHRYILWFRGQSIFVGGSPRPPCSPLPRPEPCPSSGRFLLGHFLPPVHIG